MNSALYDLYAECFPNYPIREALFYSLLVPEKAHILCKRAGSRQIGFSVIHGNSVSLLCVAEDYRNRGIGTELLELSEEYIAGTGADRVILGRGSHYLLQGVPHDSDSVAAFFEHRGYSALWTSVDMRLSLNRFHTGDIAITGLPAECGIQIFKKRGNAPASRSRS